MFIATPKDQWSSMWTKERPSAQILQRLLVLASESLHVLEEQLMDPLSSQDVKNSSAVKILFPVVDYDPAQCYLQELRDAFSDLALFFYDKHGGEVIAVLWKPLSFQPQPFKVSNMKGRMVTTLNNEPVCVPNVEAILEDFKVLGEGLVKSVEARTEKWTI
ncbi:PREDICTED: nucleolar protein 6-like [Mesitornis unicolor]|uniref:nucleolar protein 6-like n=1 Tax=Mesitornis unicolor TaxID=54374 RepID=UPI0005287DBC|nr:PREDICTED: nucleolar protein 6-like [Mesitornis unicolor]